MIKRMLPWQRKKNYVMNFGSAEGGDELALVALNGDVRDGILEGFNACYRSQGDHVKHGGKASPAPLLTLFGAGGAMAFSAANSSTLYMATANPER